MRPAKQAGSDFMLPNMRFYFLVMFFMFVASSQIYGADYSIKGRVVDLKGQPIVGAEVLVEAKAVYSEIDRLRYPVTTNSNGEFSLTKKADSGTSMNVYVTPPRTEFGVNMFDPPYSRFLRNAYPQLFRKTVTLGKARKINLGTLRVDFPLTPVKVFIEGRTGLLLNATNNLFEYWLVVEDLRGNQVEEANFGALYNQNVLSEDGTVDTVLPKGIWRIKVCDSALCEKKTLGASRLTKVGSDATSIFVKTSAD